MSCRYKLIRYDTEKEEPVRDSRGFCIEVPQGRQTSPQMWPSRYPLALPVCISRTWRSSPAGETGLFVAKIGERTPFYGYAKNQQQTEKKKLRDVFEKGDVYFNSGDLLKSDNEGFLFFQDRIGDTFRCVDETNWANHFAPYLHVFF